MNINDVLGTVLGAGEKTSHKVCDWQDFYSHGPCSEKESAFSNE